MRFRSFNLIAKGVVSSLVASVGISGLQLLIGIVLTMIVGDQSLFAYVPKLNLFTAASGGAMWTGFLIWSGMDKSLNRMAESVVIVWIGVVIGLLLVPVGSRARVAVPSDFQQAVSFPLWRDSLSIIACIGISGCLATLFTSIIDVHDRRRNGNTSA